MRAELAQSAGFCFGVRRAIDLVYKEIEKEAARGADAKPIYTYGPIIHNESVVNDLAAHGVSVLESREALAALTEGVVVIRSHGVGKDIYELLDARGLEIIDATCPFVKKIHRLVNEHSQAGERVIVVGSAAHPEVQGIVGWAEGPIEVVENAEQAAQISLSKDEKTFVVAQTTFNIEKFKVIVDILQEKVYYVNVINTICSATSERQTAARALAEKADAMIVIGSLNSSNTRKLFEICSNACPDTQLVQTAADIRFAVGVRPELVGVTAGASTPNDIIEEVLTYVRNEF